jgi:glucan phosphorylase
MSAQAMVAYLSMEIGVDAQLPTFCGGLGVLAGDTIKGAAEINFPLVGVSLRHHRVLNKKLKLPAKVLKRSNHLVS